MAFLICAASGEKNSHVKVAAGPDVRRRVDEVEAFRQAIAKLIEQLESAIEALAPRRRHCQGEPAETYRERKVASALRWGFAGRNSGG